MSKDLGLTELAKMAPKLAYLSGPLEEAPLWPPFYLLQWI